MKLLRPYLIALAIVMIWAACDRSPIGVELAPQDPSAVNSSNSAPEQRDRTPVPVFRCSNYAIAW